MLAVVELDAGAALLALGVFVLLISAAGLLGWWLLRQGRPGPAGTTEWRFEIGGKLPVDKPTFDRLARVAQTAVARPALPAETRAAIDGLRPLRDLLATVYRAGLVIGGVGGIALAVVLFRDADSANMQGLPASIILLLGLGALVSGLIPSRTVDPGPVEPIDPRLLEKVQVEVSVQPLSVTLSESEFVKAKAMHGRGSTLDQIAREVYEGYDALSDFEKRSLQQVLDDALK